MSAAEECWEGKKKKRRWINTVRGRMIDRQAEKREAKITGGWRLCGEGFEYIILHMLTINQNAHK